MEMTVNRLSGIERAAEAAPSINFVDRMCAHIATESSFTAATCREWLNGLDVDALMQSGQGQREFRTYKHDRLIEALIHLSGDQIQNLIDTLDPLMPERERSFCLHHFQLAKYHRIYDERVAVAPEEDISDWGIVSGKCVCYIEHRRWDVVTRYIKGREDDTEAQLLVRMWVRHFIEKEENLDLAAQALGGLQDGNSPLTQGRQVALQEAIVGARKYREIAHLLESESAVDHTAALALARELGQGRSTEYTDLTKGDEQRNYSERGYVHIVRVLMQREQLAKVETIANIADAAAREALLYYVAFHRRAVSTQEVTHTEAFVSHAVEAPVRMDPVEIRAPQQAEVPVRMAPEEPRTSHAVEAPVRSSPVEIRAPDPVEVPVRMAPAVEVEQGANRSQSPPSTLLDWDDIEPSSRSIFSQFIDKIAVLADWFKALLERLSACFRSAD